MSLLGTRPDVNARVERLDGPNREMDLRLQSKAETPRYRVFSCLLAVLDHLADAAPALLFRQVAKEISVDRTHSRRAAGESAVPRNPFVGRDIDRALAVAVLLSTTCEASADSRSSPIISTKEALGGHHSEAYTGPSEISKAPRLVSARRQAMEAPEDL